MTPEEVKAYDNSIKDLKRAFTRLNKLGVGASEAYDLSMKAASDAGYSM